MATLGSQKHSWPLMRWPVAIGLCGMRIRHGKWPGFFPVSEPRVSKCVNPAAVQLLARGDYNIFRTVDCRLNALQVTSSIMLTYFPFFSLCSCHLIRPGSTIRQDLCGFACCFSNKYEKISHYSL